MRSPKQEYEVPSPFTLHPKDLALEKTPVLQPSRTKYKMDQLSQHIGASVEHFVASVLHVVSKLPGSAIVGRYIIASHQNDPARTVFEVLLLLFAVRYFLASKQSYNKRNYVTLTREEVDELIAEWEPEPLVDALDLEERHNAASMPVLSSKNAAITTTEATGDRELINLSSSDLFGVSFDPVMQEVATATIGGYGVGACGPAGFYGNEDVHIKCEEDMSKFLGTEATILYSQGLSTATSVIPCFLKRGDIVVVDEAINMSCQRGIQLSRAKILWFQHNDMEDLERKLTQAVKMYRKGPLPRRFIITEGLFEYTANSPDLAKIVELKYKYKFRLILDESWSLGVLGKNGRGLCEEQNVPRDSIDITVASVGSGLGVYGGICSGSKAMVEHQRIISLAYTFSATEPPYLASMTSAVVNRMAEPEFAPRLASLRQRARQLYNILNKCNDIEMVSHADSPISIFQIKGHGSDKVLQAVVEHALEEGVLISRLYQVPQYEVFGSIQAIRLFLPEALTSNQIKAAGQAVVKSVERAVREDKDTLESV